MTPRLQMSTSRPYFVLLMISGATYLEKEAKQHQTRVGGAGKLGVVWVHGVLLVVLSVYPGVPQDVWKACSDS